MNTFPDPIPQADEDRLIATEEGRERVVMANMREACAYSYRCCHGNLEEGEIVSACYAGLVDAVKNYRPGIIRFFAYAKPYVRGKIIAEFRAKDVVRKARDQESLDAQGEIPKHPRGSHGCTFENDSDDAPLEEHYQEPEVENPKEELEAVMRCAASANLTDKERTILDLYYKSGFNFRQIGELLGVSRSHTQNECKIALRKIRNALLETTRHLDR